MPHSSAQANQNCRVFVTGMGMISPLGHDRASTTQALRNGQTHFSEVNLFDCSRQRVSTAGVIQMEHCSEESQLNDKEKQRLDRGGKILLHATEQALRNAALTEIPEGIPFIIGTSAGAMPIGEAYFRQASTAPVSRHGQFERIEFYQPQRTASTIMRGLGFRGHSQIISNACASGANAIGHAYQLIKTGRAQVALGGGYDALTEMVFSGFGSLQALCQSGIPRPFDAERDGLAIGEAAAMMVIESEASMLARDATPIAEICGYGMATDLHHLTQPHPEGDAALKSMTAACKDADIAPSEIQYINSHGTGTPLNDVAEAHAICRWAGEHAKDIMVSSTKSAMGHSLGGAGAIESAICLLALEDQHVPASLNIRTADSACQFDLVQEPRSASIDTVLTNSFGFGGCNASLIFRRQI